MDHEKKGLGGWLITAWTTGGAALVGLALILVGFAEPGTLTPSGLSFLRSPSPEPIGYWLAGILAAALLFSILPIWVRIDGEKRMEKLARENSRLMLELRRANQKIEHTAVDLVTDTITGIPNFRGWQNHARAWPHSRGAQEGSCLVLVDLDNLGALNDISYDCADKVLALFATRTYWSMRREEVAFKTPDKNGPPEIQGQAEMFRHYAGGDEFCFHLSDDVPATIGFLNRLTEACRRYEAEIKADILPKFMTTDQISGYKLSFCAAILPIKPGALLEDRISPALTLMNRAKKHPTSRLQIQFDSRDPAKTLEERTTDLEKEIRGIEGTLETISQDESEGADSKSERIETLRTQVAKRQELANFLRRVAPSFVK